MRPNLIKLFLLAALAAQFSAPTRADDKPITLTRTYKKGDVLRYKAESEITVGGFHPRLTGTSRSTIKDVKENGQVVFEEVAEGGKLTGAGDDRDIPEQPAATVTRDKNGKLVDVKLPDTALGLQSPEITRLMVTIGTIILSEKPVKPGDSWETEADNPVVKEKKVKIKTTFVGLEKVEGKEFWKLKQTSEPSVDANNGKVVYASITWLDPANGQEAKSEVSIKDLPAAFGLLTIKTKAERLKAGEKSDK